MAWILYLLVWITITVSAYKCMHTSYTSKGSGSRFHYDYASQESIVFPDNRAYERMNKRSTNISPASYSPTVTDDIKSAKLRIAEQTSTRTESESKALSWKPYAESRRGQNNDKIVFAGPTSATTSNEFELEISEHCQPLEIPNYLKAQAEKVIEEISEQRKFQEDLLDLPDVPDITQRVGRSEDNIELCRFKQVFLYLNATVNSSGKLHTAWHRYYTRIYGGFEAEICEYVSTKDDKSSELQINEGEWKTLPTCEKFVNFMGKREGRCIQKYVVRNITVLHPNGTQLECRRRVPSHCSCVARLTNST